VLGFPRVLIPLVSLKGGAGHHPGRRGLVQVGLNPPPSRMELFARDPQLAREAGRRLTLGNPAQSQHQGRRALTGFREDRPSQKRVVTIAGPTAIGRKMAMGAE
jgi:hypothetical protein